jgi:hypothetical protein
MGRTCCSTAVGPLRQRSYPARDMRSQWRYLESRVQTVLSLVSSTGGLSDRAWTFWGMPLLSLALYGPRPRVLHGCLCCCRHGSFLP